MVLTAKQEQFALNLLNMTQREAWIKAGYSSNYALSNVDRNACILANQTKIKQRLAQLRKRAEDESIATLIQRKQVASKITLATIADFVDEYGNLNITNKAQLNTPAVAELKTERTARGIRTTLKLRDPLAGADLLNKMDKIYSEAYVNVNDNRVINFIGDQSLIDGIVRRLNGQERIEERTVQGKNEEDA